MKTIRKYKYLLTKGSMIAINQETKNTMQKYSEYCICEGFFENNTTIEREISMLNTKTCKNRHENLQKSMENFSKKKKGRWLRWMRKPGKGEGEGWTIVVQTCKPNLFYALSSITPLYKIIKNKSKNKPTTI